MSKERIIKFRAWDGERMYLSPNELDHLGSWFDAHWPGSISKLRREKGLSVPILMQFTGLLDKEGKEIYEHDLIERNGHTYKVTFESGGFCLTGKNFEPLDQIHIMHHDRFLNNFLPNCKVIGNIYTTPLKEEKV
jgi:hypothetical protein